MAPRELQRQTLKLISPQHFFVDISRPKFCRLYCYTVIRFIFDPCCPLQRSSEDISPQLCYCLLCFPVFCFFTLLLLFCYLLFFTVFFCLYRLFYCLVVFPNLFLVFLSSLISVFSCLFLALGFFDCLLISSIFLMYFALHLYFMCLI